MDTPTAKGGLRSTPNVTPLVDVVLVLLIQFLVLIPAVQAAVRLPRAGAAPSTEGQPPVFVVGIGPKGAWVGQEQREGSLEQVPVSDPAGMERLLVAAGPELGRAGGVLLLKADARLPFIEVHNWLEACRRLGVREVLAATQGLEAHPEVP